MIRNVVARTIAVGLTATVFALAGAGPALSLDFLTFLDAETPGPAGPLKRATDIAVSGDGLSIYAVSDQQNNIVLLDREGPGTISAVMQELVDGAGAGPALARPEAVAVSVDSLCVYVAANTADSLTVFDRTPGTGVLAFLEAHEDDVSGVDGLRAASAVASSTDGACVYAAGEQDGAVVVFTRSPPSCALTYLENVADGVGGVPMESMPRPGSIAVSPDDANVYVTSKSNGSVTTFSRSLPDCSLVFEQSLADGKITPGLGGAIDVAVSGDDDHVYVAARGDEALTVYSRDTGGVGDLTQIQVLEDGKGGADGLETIEGLALSPDGAYLYTAANDGVALYERDAGTGLLTFINLLQSGQNGLADFEGPEAVAASPDSLHAYVAGSRSDSVAAFDRTTAVSCPAVPMGGCIVATEAEAVQLQFKDKTPDKSDKLKWKMNKGEATTIADFGAYDSTNSFAVCTWDTSAGVTLISEGTVIPGACSKACWKLNGSGNSLKFKDKGSSPLGINQIKLKEGLLDGEAKLQVKGKGELLDTPTLPLTPPVGFQLITSEGKCWSSAFSSFTKNEAGQYKAKSD